MDDITREWIRNESDERAAHAGYRFDLARACYTVWWIERYCKLYEGEWAGEPLILRGAHSQQFNPLMGDDFEDDEQDALLRAYAYNEAYQGGEACDWQYECTMRTFGWCKHDDEWGREIRRFKKAGIWVPKKNKKSPTLAAWGLYLLAGDGEQGQKVWIGAKDGNQASIATRHAIEMVSRSPELTAICEINRNLKRISVPETSSFLQPMASSNKRTQDARHGENGSMLVDETHVVDENFMQITKRMIISRSEPIVAQFSTSGSNPDSYGKGQFDYGSDVLEGRITDHQYFAAIYAAPQDLKDEDLAADPEKYAKMANPAWGHTIRRSEIVSDYTESSRRVSDLAGFKYQRLNIWTSSSNPWKIASRWAENATAIKLADFAGEPCWMGADLSRARDMSALVLTFRDESGDAPKYYQFCWAWMVREYAEKHKSKAAFLQWEHDGLITFCENAIDLREIEDVIGELSQQYAIAEFRHDPAYAHELAARLEDQYSILAVPFKQTMTNYAKPVDDFEAAVIEGNLHHDGHAVYNWQIGHAVVKSDNNNNRRIVKPTDDDYRKVDIVQAGIMSLSGAMAADSDMSVYATRGVLYAGA